MQTKVSIADTKLLNHEEWLEQRRHGIGGSDAAAIMGVSKYSSPLSVYMDKLGLSEPVEQNEAMRQGTDLEAYVAERFTEATGKKVRRCNKILQHPDYPWMLANIDRDVIGEDAGLECKTINPMNSYDFENGEVPVHYRWQSQHYMAVTGASKWYIAVLVLGKAFYIFEEQRDEELINMLVRAESEFWNEHVLKQVPPFPTGTDADEEAIATMYPEADSMIEAVDLVSVSDALDMLEYQKSAYKHLESSIKALEEQVKLQLGEAEKGFTERWNVSWKNGQRSSFDSKAFKKDYPELAERYTNQTFTRTFRVSKVKGA